MKPPPLLDYDEILRILPHRPPFLFVDLVWELVPGKSIIAERRLRPDESQFQGHFPGQPVMPGVLVSEAIAQTSGLLLALTERSSGTPPPARPKMYYLAETRFKFSHPALPNDILTLRAETDGALGTLFRFRGEARVGEKCIAAGSLTLAFVSE